MLDFRSVLGLGSLHVIVDPQTVQGLLHIVPSGVAVQARLLASISSSSFHHPTLMVHDRGAHLVP